MDATVASIVDAVSGGYSTNMTVTYFLDEMCEWDTDDDDYYDVKFLRKNMICKAKTMLGDERVWLDQGKWSELLEDPKNWPEFELMLRALDNYDVGLGYAIRESSLCEDDLDTEEAQKLFREFCDSDKDYNGIDGLLQASRKLQETT